MDAFWKDIKFGVRVLLRSPGFLATAILTLALGIGANTALFSVVKGVLLDPLPFPRK
jgi:putative ABC transport system permease protein